MKGMGTMSQSPPPTQSLDQLDVPSDILPPMDSEGTFTADQKWKCVHRHDTQKTAPKEAKHLEKSDKATIAKKK